VFFHDPPNSQKVAGRFPANQLINSNESPTPRNVMRRLAQMELTTLAASTTLPMLPATALTGNSGCQQTALKWSWSHFVRARQET
jgi:hypothetical protein